jgi:predicted phosphoadenosine phosphosulfate sulfurtransferase
MRCDVKHETAKRKYLDIDVYDAAQQRFRFLFREFERNQDD